MFVFIAIILLYSSFGCVRTNNSNSNIFATIFTQDSGYISIQDTRLLLKEAKVLDTLYLKENSDSVVYSGKYYKDLSKNNFIAYVYNSQLNRYQLLKVNIVDRTILVGDYSFSTDYEKDFSTRFLKRGDYYYLTMVCDKGPAYDSECFYLFKDINNMGNPIIESLWNATLGEQCHAFTSEFEIINDTLKMHYFLEDGIIVQLDDGFFDFKVESKTEVTIPYIFTNNEWSVSDTSALHKYSSLYW